MKIELPDLNKMPNVDKELVFNHLQKLGVIETFFYWIIDSKFARGINLKQWCTSQLYNKKLQEIVEQQKFKSIVDEDKRVLSILTYFKDGGKYGMVYKGDKENYGKNEYWATVQEFLDTKLDDCDGFANLLYHACIASEIPVNRLYIVAGNVDDGSNSLSTNVKTTKYINKLDNKQSEEQCLKELKDFKKEILNGNIRYQSLIEYRKDNDYLLKQSLNKVINLSIKEKLVLILEDILSGNMYKIDNKFVIDVKKQIEQNSAYTILTKIDWITQQLIWKYYVENVMQDITIQTIQDLKKINSRTTQGQVGHCYVVYVNNKGLEVPIDGCYWTQDCYALKPYVQNANYFNGTKEWFRFSHNSMYKNVY